MGKFVIFRAFKPLEVRILIEIVDEDVLVGIFYWSEALAITEQVQELVQDAEEEITSLDGKALVWLAQVLLVHLLEGRIVPSTLKILQRWQRPEHGVLVLKFWHLEVIREATINIADGNILPILHLEMLKRLNQTWTADEDWEGWLDHADASFAGRLHVRVLEGQRKHELKQSLRDVKLQAELWWDQNKGLVEQNSLPAVHDGADVEHLKQHADSQLILVWNLIEVRLRQRQSLIKELNVEFGVERGAGYRDEEGQMRHKLRVREVQVLLLSRQWLLLADDFLRYTDRFE